MLWCQEICDQNPVSGAISVFKNENDLGVAYRLAVRKTDFGTKPHGLAGQLLCERLQAGFYKPGGLGNRTAGAFGECKLSDFSFVVERYCERQKSAGPIEGQPCRMD